MTTTGRANRLANEKSPYLLQHRFNPVDWYPWGEEAFEKARRENKPVFLSIGYSTCYWCHVMEQDSFELDDVAAILNEHYVSIKVDREERPDVDQIYMDVVVGLTGHGGWPMSVLLTPDKEPFWGGTFFYREQFKQILAKIAEVWRGEPERIHLSAKEIASVVRQEEPAGESANLSLVDILERGANQFKAGFDTEHGGFGSAPKFPPATALRFLMRWAERSGDPGAREIVAHTLDRMGRGGIYDHLGGGFHRYSVDAEWRVPHFEKMLYDNALLATAYLEGWQLLRDATLADVARDTLRYVIREMRSDRGGFYSAQDAGEVGKEGEYYVWTHGELASVLSAEELDRIVEAYGVTHAGNFEHGTNVLHLSDGSAWEAKRTPVMRKAYGILHGLRSKRTAPHLDDKVLTAWNGLMIGALAKGARVLGEPEFLDAAQHAALFVRDNLVRGGKLLRRYRDGEANFHGCLDDYAYLVAGLLELYQADGDAEWLRFAERMHLMQHEMLWDATAGGYFYSSATDLIARKKEIHDGATPSPSAVALANAQKLATLTGEPRYRDEFEAHLSSLRSMVERRPAAFAAILCVLDWEAGPAREIVIVSPSNDGQVKALREIVDQSFLPNAIVLSVPEGADYPLLLQGKSARDDRATVYVCENRTCGVPVYSAKDLANALAKRL